MARSHPLARPAPQPRPAAGDRSSLIVTTSFPPDQGGVAALVGNIARSLPSPPLVLAPAPAAQARDSASTDGSPLRPSWVSLRHTGLAGKLAYRLLWSLHPCLYYLVHFWPRAAALAAARRPGVVQCGHVFLGLVALGLKLRHGTPYAVYAHAQEVRRSRGQGVLAVDRLLRGVVLRRASAVFVLSAYTRERVLEWGVDPRRIVRLSPGGRLEPVEPVAPPAPVDARQPVLLTVARLVPRKGVDTVIAALQRVRVRYPGVRYVIVGGGPDEDRLRGLVRSAGLDDFVAFAGPVEAPALADYYAACDLFVMPAREAGDGEVEGFGLVFLEAAAYGKAAVAGRSGGQPDAVLDGVTGLLVEPSDADDLARAILRLLDDGALRERLGRAARQRVEGECTWQRAAEQVQRVLERLEQAGNGAACP